MKSLLKKFNRTGDCIIDTKEICKQWKDFWLISEYDLKYTFIIPDRRSNEITKLKVQISTNQAREIINSIGLKRMASSIFKKGATWKIYK